MIDDQHNVESIYSQGWWAGYQSGVVATVIVMSLIMVLAVKFGG